MCILRFDTTKHFAKEVVSSYSPNESIWGVCYSMSLPTLVLSALFTLASRYVYSVTYEHALFHHALLYFASQILFFFFLHIESSWQPCIRQVCWHYFSNSICSLCVCVIFWQFSQYFILSHYYYIAMVICNKWSLILLFYLFSVATSHTHIRHQT